MTRIFHILLALLILGLCSSAHAAPAINATDRDTLQVDNNADGDVNRGDVIRHTITITNTGDTEADAVQFINNLDPDATLVPGSVKTTPLAIDDSYTVNEDTTLTVAAPGVLSNDRDPDGGSISALEVTGPSHGTLTLNTNGSFEYVPEASYEGPDGFTYKNNDGTSDSNTASVSITVLHVNKAPTDIALDNGSVAENSPSGTSVGTFSTTDPDAGDTHAYSLVSGTGSGDNASFSISGNRLLTAAVFNYEVKNSYSIRVRTTDNGSPSLSYEKVFVISVTDVNEAPSATNKPYNVLGNVRISVPADGLKTGATDPDAADTYASLSVAAFTGKSSQQGDVVINTDGSFTYDPPVGYTGTDTFTYQVCDTGGLCSPNATVTLTVNNMIWFIDNKAGACSSNCDGRLTHPFTTLASFQAINDGIGMHPKQNQHIFIYESSSDYTGPVTLLTGQRLIGQDSTSSLSARTGITPPANSDPLPAMDSSNGTYTRVVNPSGSSVTLGQNNYIYGLTLGNASATALSGTNFGTLTFADVAINTTGSALSLNTGTMSGSFISVTSSGGANNIGLTGVNGSGTVNFGGGALSGSTSNAFYISGGTAAIDYSGSITSAAGRSVNISGKTGGTVTLTGAVSGSGSGVYLNGNSSTTVNFTGGVNLSTGANAAFTATGIGTVSVTGTTNTLSTTTGTALDVSNTIGADGLNFQSISSGTAASGPASGIILGNTGSGALTVSGTGSAGSGGTIRKTTQSAISLSGAVNVALNYMYIHDNAGSGISAANISGTLNMTGCTLQNTGNDAVRISNDTAGLFSFAATFTGCAFDTTTYGRGLLLQTSTNQAVNLTVTGQAFSHSSPGNATCRFVNLNQSAVLVSAASPSSSNVTVENCYFNSNSAGDGVKVNPGGGTSTVRVKDNLIDGIGDGDSHAGDGVDIEADGTAVLSANVTGNTIRNINHALMTSQGRGVRIKRDETSYTKVLVDTNSISTTFGEGILVEARKNDSPSAPSADSNVVVTNNTLANTNLRGGVPVTGAGINIRAWEGAADVSAKVTSCVAVSGNNVSGSGNYDYMLYQRNSAVFQLEGYSGTVTDITAISNYLKSLNLGTPAISIDIASMGIVNGTCERPAP